MYRYPGFPMIATPERPSASATSNKAPDTDAVIAPDKPRLGTAIRPTIGRTMLSKSKATPDLRRQLEMGSSVVPGCWFISNQKILLRFGIGNRHPGWGSEGGFAGAAYHCSLGASLGSAGSAAYTLKAKSTG
jgi:hypothetical protein